MLARIKVPKELLGRFIELSSEKERVLVPLEEVIAANLDQLFPGVEVLDHSYFRVTRDADFTVSDEADDLLEAVQEEVRRRRFRGGRAAGSRRRDEPGAKELLVELLRLQQTKYSKPAACSTLTDLWDVVKLGGFQELRDKPWVPGHPAPAAGRGRRPPDIFGGDPPARRAGPSPYDSFSSSVERFIAQAVSDPDVLAIKQTVYRTSEDLAAGLGPDQGIGKGKQVVCMLELKARFDEEANIEWAKRLEEVGVHVVYGIPGLKTHIKALLVVRREGDQVRNYVHIGTGNYHSTTARLYTDLGLFTADPEIGADVAEMFNLLTGYSRPADYRRVLVSFAFGCVPRSWPRSKPRSPPKGRPGGEDPDEDELVGRPDPSRRFTGPSQAGVEVEINVRGICCLRPGVPELGEHPGGLPGRPVPRAFTGHAFQRGGTGTSSSARPT